MDPTQTPAETLPAAAVGWEGRLARGFRLARVSWEVLAGDRRLLALPLMAAVCALGAVVATATLARRVHGGPEVVHVIAPVWIAAYLVSTTIFCNVALVHVVVRRWQGEPAGLVDGLVAAGRRLAAIAGWSALTTTVGIALRLLECVMLGLSQLLVGIVAGAAWSVGSFFVVPALVVERQGPLRALRRSAEIVRGRWVEGFSGATPIGLATLMVALPVLGLLLMGCLLYVTGLPALGMLRWSAPASRSASSGSSAAR